jgi:hypothetical protein
MKAGGDVCKGKIYDFVWKADTPIIDVGKYFVALSLPCQKQ